METKTQFDSDEEMYFFWWLEELKEKGFIKDFELQPLPFDLSTSLWCEHRVQMKTKTKMVNEEVMPGHIYTADAFIIWNENALDRFTTLIDSEVKKKENRSMKFILSQKDSKGQIYSFVEVKPSFDQNNMTRLAKLNQKWVWDKLEVYVNIVIPQKHFNKTFTPGRFIFTNKSRVVRKIKYKNVITLYEFCQNNGFIEGTRRDDDSEMDRLF